MPGLGRLVVVLCAGSVTGLLDMALVLIFETPMYTGGLHPLLVGYNLALPAEHLPAMLDQFVSVFVLGIL